jgi:GST-like protein
MIDLYGMTSPNVVKVVLALEELELPYTFHFVNVFMGEQFEPAFGALTPNRKVPVIVDSDGPDGEPLTLWESGAILVYLADKAGRLIPKKAKDRFITLQWLMFQMGGIGPMFGQHSHFQIFAPETEHAYSRARYTTEVKRLYDVAETRLGESEWLAGPDYTIADVAAWPWLRSAKFRGLDFAPWPNVERWVQAIGERPGTKRALAQVAAMPRPDLEGMKREHGDRLDRYLGRGRFSRA